MYVCAYTENYRNGTLISLSVTHYYPKNLYFLRMNVRHMNINAFGFLVVIKNKSSLC